MIQQLDSRIVEKASNCILVKKSEVSQLVDSAYYETKGEGAKKLSKQMFQIYRGLSRRMIQHGLNSMKQQQKVRPFFKTEYVALLPACVVSVKNLRYRVKSVYEGAIHSIVV